MAGPLASVGGGGDPWYLAGGAPDPVAVYNVREAGSLAASYVNPFGTDIVPGGVAPTWSATTGWGFTTGLSTYLRTGIAPATNYAMIWRFLGAAAADGVVAGVRQGSVFFTLRPYFLHLGTPKVLYGLGSNINILVAPNITAGTLALAGTSAYRNGTSESGAGGAIGSLIRDIYIGARNLDGTPNAHITANVLYGAIWNTSIGHATWMPAVSAAVAAL